MRPPFHALSVVGSVVWGVQALAGRRYVALNVFICEYQSWLISKVVLKTFQLSGIAFQLSDIALVPPTQPFQNPNQVGSPNRQKKHLFEPTHVTTDKKCASLGSSTETQTGWMVIMTSACQTS